MVDIRTMTKTGKPYELFTRAVWEQIVNKDSVEPIEVQHNVDLVGRSGESHQIDVYWRFRYAGTEHSVVVEARDRSRRVEKAHVAAFVAILADLPGRPKGFMVSSKGFQAGAIGFAKTHDICLYELRPINDSDWKGLIRAIRIDYAIFAPHFYPRGVEFDHDAARAMLRESGIKEPFSFATNLGPETVLHLEDGRTSPLLDLLQEEVDVSQACERTSARLLFRSGCSIEHDHLLVSRLPVISIEFDYEVQELRGSVTVDAGEFAAFILKSLSGEDRFLIDENHNLLS